jgi:outer membrane protein OmpA-like peptidoglycan-associated protein
VNDDQKQLVALGTALLIPILLVAIWASAAGRRYVQSQKENDPSKQAAIASVSDDSYCTPALKAIIRRVAGACGLIEGGGGRGCQPMQAQKVAALSGDDFNAMFRPLAKRAHIVQFDAQKTDLDEDAKKMVEKAWGDQRGASFFFVVSRASPDGAADYNEGLSRDRAKAVLEHLQKKYPKDDDLKNQVGLLWLGEEYAQLSEEFCSWSRSRSGACTPTDINRSAFVAWIDCAI